ncbi:MAG TPA: tripartite tricarboxylate transporter substrate-binding protein [Gammaproteobacteria bacterium]
MRLVAAAVALLVSTSSFAQQSGTAAISEFYEGRELRLLIGYSAGGGYDTYARLLARHLARHIPGNPAVVPQNMPGAASLRVANYLFNVAPKDGSVIGIVARGMAMEPLLSARGTQFDATGFSWLGSLNNEVSVCASWHTSDVKTMQDLQTRELIVGGIGSASGTDVFPLVVKNLLGGNIRLITGYPGGNDILLAMERGEVDGRCGWSWSTVQATRPDWIAEGRLNMLVQFALEKHPDLPDVPLVTEFADSEDERMALELIFARQVMGRPFLAPPGIPPARLAALRRAFDATAEDPEFLAEAARMQLELNPVSGEEIDALLERVYGASENAIRLATEAIRND